MARPDDIDRVPARFMAVFVAVLGGVVLVGGLLLQPVSGAFELSARLEPISLARLATASARLVVLGAVVLGVCGLAAWRLAGRSLTAKKASWSMAMATLVVGVISLEVLLRVVPAYSARQVYDRSPAYAPSRFAFHQFAAQDHDILDTVDLSPAAAPTATLREGYRGTPFSAVKPPGERRIVIFGGSHVYDSNAGLGRSWPALVEQGLRNRGFEEVRVINAGIPGHTVLDSVGRLLAEVHLLRPDVIVLCHTYNDLRYFRWVGPDRTLLRHLPTLIRPSAPTSGRLPGWLAWSQIALRVSQTLPEEKRGFSERTIAYADLPDAPSPHAVDQFSLALRTFVAVGHRIGAAPVLLTQARAIVPDNVDRVRNLRLGNHTSFSYGSAVDAFALADETIRRVAEEEGAYFFDVAERHSGNPADFADLIHLTPKGSEALAESVAAFLGDLLLSLGTEP